MPFLLRYLIYSSMICMAVGDTCMNECTCKWKGGKRTVECVNRGLTNIPEWIDPETQVLDVSNNTIGVLKNQIFERVRLTNLQRLYLRHCHIKQIDNDALAGLTNLIELDLSFNQLTRVPSTSFSNTPFLRDLILLNNPIKQIHSHAFEETPNLVKLDLSFTELYNLSSNGFQGLENLESLKLNNNRLHTLTSGTFTPLKKVTSIELHDNPWICDCHLREMKQWLVKHNLPTLIAPICRGPEQLANRSFTELFVDDYACRPVLLIASRYAEATIGENASIVCRVSSIPPAQVKWYWNSRQLTNHSAINSYQKILIYEDGNFQKMSTLVLTNAQEVDSSEFICVAENRAGSVEANFTLRVAFQAAGISSLGSGQIAGISAALVVLILFILLIILILFIRLRRMPRKDVKSPTLGDEGTMDSGNSTQDNNPQSATSTVSRRKIQEIDTSGIDSKPPGSLNLSYVQRPNAVNVATEDEYIVSRNNEKTQLQQLIVAGPCFPSAVSLMSVDNPDLIRDTRQGPGEEPVPPYGGEYCGVDLDENRLVYSANLWETRDTSRATVSVNPYSSKETLASTTALGSFPPGAKQMRVWQKGVPVLPPVSALKRVLGSTRSSPDEGYQEGTGTDV